MADLPAITANDVASNISGVTDIESPQSGGQKLVFPCGFYGNKYALKFLLVERTHGQQPTSDPAAIVQRAQREIEIMRKCQNNRIASLGAIGPGVLNIGNEVIFFFSEEWIDGESLHEILSQNGPLSLPDVIDLGKQMVEAIDVLALQNMIHRDVKPGNIMRREGSNDFVLTDFGLAFDLAGTSLTKSGYVVGTPQFLSPEQCDPAKRRQMDHRSDLFSLGIVLHQAATGLHPFGITSGMDAPACMDCICRHRPDRASAMRSDIPAELDRILLKMLMKPPHLRYFKCNELIEHLNRVPV